MMKRQDRKEVLYLFLSCSAIAVCAVVSYFVYCVFIILQ